jgi:hypothetical protein
MSHDYDYVPETNLTLYKLLFAIETVLRELIIEVIEGKDGPRGWKQRLPGDVLGKFRDARLYEQRVSWRQLVPHHPIYYVDFPDLKKVIVERRNWVDLFRVTFGRVDWLDSALTELEPIRNSVAHNRKATVADVQLTETTLNKLVNAIGEQRFEALVSRCSIAIDVRASLTRLLSEAELTLQKCLAFSPIESLPVWESIQRSWWFDSDYLGQDIGATTDFFESAEEYSNLPRGRGMGHTIEAWVNSNPINEKYQQSQQELNKLLQQGE